MINTEYKETEKNHSSVFNYSSIHLTDSMLKLLNRGLNFSVLPAKKDFTQLLVDCTKFERSAIWTEFSYGREDKENKEKNIIS